MKRIIVFLIALLLIFWGFEHFLNNQKSAPEAALTTPSIPGKAPRLAPITFTPETVAPINEGEVPLLDQINREYVKVIQAVLPSVVNVFTSRPANLSAAIEDPFGLPFSPEPSPAPKPGHRNIPVPRDSSLGSGVIISKEGHIITNGHVVKDADEISVQLWDNRRYTAKVVGADDPADIAILKIDAPNLKPLAWGDSNKIQIGEQVLAIGNPFGLSESISNGIVSAKGRNPGFGPNNYEDFIQTNAAINPGNSGGALVNIRGELIGINTAIASTNRGFQGIGFALPSNLARFAVDSLIRTGKVVRGYLGVTIQEIKPDLQEAFNLKSDEGALITDVAPGSPASKGGLERGDVVVRFDTTQIDEPAQLRLAVSQTPIGKLVDVTIYHMGKLKTVSLKVAELPPEFAKAGALTQEPDANPSTGVADLQNVLAGIKVQNLDDPLRKRHNLPPDATGVIITAIEEGSIAEARGLQLGDIIEEIRPKGDNTVQKITDLQSYLAIAKKIKPNQDAVLLLRHGHATSFVNLPAGNK